MNVLPYKTVGGKNLITAYIDKLSIDEMVDGYDVLDKLEQDRLNELKIEHWRNQIYEVYFYKHNRIFYVVADGKDMYLLHACRKQKNKTESKDSEIIIKRAKKVGSILGMKFI